jgi:hypothetical protein
MGSNRLPSYGAQQFRVEDYLKPSMFENPWAVLERKLAGAQHSSVQTAAPTDVEDNFSAPSDVSESDTHRD